MELHPEKTRWIEFGRFAKERRRKRGQGKPESFNFLGFTPIRAASRKGKLHIERRTLAPRFRAKLAERQAALWKRRHLPVPVQGARLRSVVQGHDPYYGVPLNGKALQRFRKEVARRWQRSLSRRSHKGYVVWERMKRDVDKGLPVARLYPPYPDERFGAMTRGRSPVR